MMGMEVSGGHDSESASTLTSEKDSEGVSFDVGDALIDQNDLAVGGDDDLGNNGTCGGTGSGVTSSRRAAAAAAGKKMMKQALRQQAKRRRKNTNVAAGCHATPTLQSQCEVDEVSTTNIVELEDGVKYRQPTMAEVLASIPGWSVKPRSRQRGPRKLSAAAQLEQTTREGCVDLETPDSILVSSNLRQLLNKHTFSSLPPLYQYKLLQLLPRVDRTPAPHSSYLYRLSALGLNNEFFARACMDWRERLAEGEFTPENQAKLKAEHDRDKSRLDPWKLKHFEPMWGESLEEWPALGGAGVMTGLSMPGIGVPTIVGGGMGNQTMDGNIPTSEQLSISVCNSTASNMLSVASAAAATSPTLSQKKKRSSGSGGALVNSTVSVAPPKPQPPPRPLRTVGAMTRSLRQAVGAQPHHAPAEVSEPSPPLPSVVVEAVSQEDVSTEVVVEQQLSANTTPVQDDAMDVDDVETKVNIEITTKENIVKEEEYEETISNELDSVTDGISDIKEEPIEDLSIGNRVVVEEVKMDITDNEETVSLREESIPEVKDNVETISSISEESEQGTVITVDGLRYSVATSVAADGPTVSCVAIDQMPSASTPSNEVITPNYVSNNESVMMSGTPVEVVLSRMVADSMLCTTSASQSSESSLTISESVSNISPAVSTAWEVIKVDPTSDSSSQVKESVVVDEEAILAAAWQAVSSHNIEQLTNTANIDEVSVIPCQEELEVTLEETRPEDNVELMETNSPTTAISSVGCIGSRSITVSCDSGVTLHQSVDNIRQHQISTMSSNLLTSVSEGARLQPCSVAAVTAASSLTTTIPTSNVNLISSIPVSGDSSKILEVTSGTSSSMATLPTISETRMVSAPMTWPTLPSGATLQPAMASHSGHVKLELEVTLTPESQVTSSSSGIITSAGLAGSRGNGVGNSNSMVGSSAETCPTVIPPTTIVCLSSAPRPPPAATHASCLPYLALTTSTPVRAVATRMGRSDSGSISRGGSRSGRNQQSSRPPPGAINLERSYQICQAVIENSPNRDQLQGQLRPPPSLLSTQPPSSGGMIGGASSGIQRTQQSTPGQQQSLSVGGVTTSTTTVVTTPRHHHHPLQQQATPLLLKRVFTSHAGIPVNMALLPNNSNSTVRYGGVRRSNSAPPAGGGSAGLPRAGSTVGNTINAAVGGARPASVGLAARHHLTAAVSASASLPPPSLPASASLASPTAIDCSCALKPMQACAKCGAFCHQDCITASSLCITCHTN